MVQRKVTNQYGSVAIIAILAIVILLAVSAFVALKPGHNLLFLPTDETKTVGKLQIQVADIPAETIRDVLQVNLLYLADTSDKIRVVDVKRFNAYLAQPISTPTDAPYLLQLLDKSDHVITSTPFYVQTTAIGERKDPPQGYPVTVREVAFAKTVPYQTNATSLRIIDPTGKILAPTFLKDLHSSNATEPAYEEKPVNGAQSDAIHTLMNGVGTHNCDAPASATNTDLCIAITAKPQNGGQFKVGVPITIAWKAQNVTDKGAVAINGPDYTLANQIKVNHFVGSEGSFIYTPTKPGLQVFRASADNDLGAAAQKRDYAIFTVNGEETKEEKAKKMFEIVIFDNNFDNADQFLSEAMKLQTRILETEPFLSHQRDISFHLIRPRDYIVHIPGRGGNGKNYFNCKYSVSTIQANDLTNTLIWCNDDDAEALANALKVKHNLKIILHHDTNHTIVSGNDYAAANSIDLNDGISDEQVLMHLFGHVFNLQDEFPYFDYESPSHPWELEAPIDNMVHQNCYAGQPPAAAWKDIVRPQEYTPGCVYKGWYNSGGRTSTSGGSYMGRYLNSDAYNRVSELIIQHKLESIVSGQ